jgi:hypothetical protein
MMLVICIPMMRRMPGSKDEHGAVSGEEIAKLREEITLLRAERTLSSSSSEVTGG